MGRIIAAAPRQGGGRRIAAEVASATAEAANILEAARQGAKDLERDLERRAREQAHAELAAEYVALASGRAAHDAELEAQLAALALSAAGTLLRRELARTPEAMADVIRPLLGKLRGATRVTLHLHPEDAPGVRAWLTTEGAPEGAVRVLESQDLTRGDCIVESDVGSLDARIETRLAALARTLGIPRGVPEDEPKAP